MKTISVIDKYIVAVASEDPQLKFLLPLSNLIKTEFGSGPFIEKDIPGIISSCMKFYADKFEEICQKEKSYTFYKMIFWFNEQVTEMHRDKSAQTNLPKEIDSNYLAIYRRILKMILEQGCSVNMVTGEKIDVALKNRFSEIFDELFFLGESVIRCAENYAEEEMITDAIDAGFDSKGLLRFKRKHFYEDAFRYIVAKNVYEPESFVIDNKANEDFITAVKDCFGIDYSNVMQLFVYLMQHHKLEPGVAIAVGRNDLSYGLNQLFDITQDIAENFFSGLYFTSAHRLPVGKLVTRPYDINRFLYRPILIWNVDGKDFCVFGLFSFQEAIQSLYYNAFPWGKMAPEWKENIKFKTFIDRKSDQHDKWLDDAVENQLKDTGIVYTRDVKSIKTRKGDISIDNSKCGQIDFLCINVLTKKIFIVECKHLLGRYDMSSQKIDFYNFTVGNNNKSYNETIDRKIEWVKANICLIEEHFKLLSNQPGLSILDFVVQGIFIVNTPTFYMYNSDIRIYTYHEIAKVLLGTYVDKTYSLYTIDDDYQSIVWVKFPYFKKKKMVNCEWPDDDDEEVDKYGHSIKK